MLFYLDLHVFAVKKGLSRLMEKSSGTDVRHTWVSKSCSLFACGTLASYLTAPSLSFICTMGIKPVSED